MLPMFTVTVVSLCGKIVIGLHFSLSHQNRSMLLEFKSCSRKNTEQDTSQLLGFFSASVFSSVEWENWTELHNI